MMALPKGYIKVEYIESSGGQYIDTGFYPKYNSRVVVDVSDLPDTDAFVFGARTESAVGQFAVYRRTNSRVRSDYYGTTVTGSVGDTTGRGIIDKNANVLTAYGVVVTNTAVSSGTTGCSLPLFALSTGGSISHYASCRLYACQIYDNGILVRDYVPCVNASGEAGLYDLVNDVFYGNAGTGSFIAGPELAVDTPTGFEQVLGVCLRWSAVNCEGYRLYRDGEAIAETTNTFYADLDVEAGETYTYSVTAYRGTTESAPAAEIEVYTRTGYFVIKPLIQSAFFQ